MCLSYQIMDHNLHIIFGKFSRSFRNSTGSQYNFSPSNEWVLWEDDLDSKGYVEVLCSGLCWEPKELSTLMEFSYNKSYQTGIQMVPFEALYGRSYKSLIGWFEVGEANLLRPNLVQESLDKVHLIKERMLAAQSRQKAYVNHRRWDLEFPVDDHLFLQVSLMKEVMRFKNKVKLSPWYISPYEILEMIGAMAYQPAMPPSPYIIHLMFHTHLMSLCYKLSSWMETYPM